MNSLNKRNPQLPCEPDGADISTSDIPSYRANPFAWLIKTINKSDIAELHSVTTIKIKL